MPLLSELLIILPLFIISGLFVGFINGFLGVGGGTVIVPLLIPIFSALGYPETAGHMAIGTSLSVIAVISWRSTLTHKKLGNVDPELFVPWALGLIPGVLIGTFFIFPRVSGSFLIIFFCNLTFIIAAYMIIRSLLAVVKTPFTQKIKAFFRVKDSLPTQGALSTRSFYLLVISGGLTGMTSALMGIGGGALAVPLLILFGAQASRAIGTAASMGIIIGFLGVLGSLFSGWSLEGRPPVSLGYINLLAFITLMPLGFLTAPIGARLSTRFNPNKMKLIFGIYLLIISFILLYRELGLV